MHKFVWVLDKYALSFLYVCFFGAITLEQNAEDSLIVVRNVIESFSIDDC